MDFEQMYKHDIFANQTGVILDSLSEQGATMHITVTKEHLNAGGYAHGGIVFLLADISMAAIANFMQAPSVSIQSDIRFLAASSEGDVLTAEATGVYGSKSMYNCRVNIKNQNGNLIAIAEGMFHTKRKFTVAEQ